MKTGPNEPNYDQWKTNIPLSYEDDGEEYSNCCGAPRLGNLESDICSDCLEHCDFEEWEEV